ncbi:hypothetical protein FD17_GL000986 [Lentilactobacillus sunkii DSM 19904]|uniref:Endoribonuclease YoeB n=1 Tax=Lentilactobacillus sunkii DSM 19904 TaxID=1423808 RepID=A0A0R1L0Q9_9LACO|nr:hypothetical protein FD17_GL000986 [Lentilactobacillus sunkii DSM 19904]
MEFSQKAWGEYVSWETEDKETLKRINSLINEILRHPFDGAGKPEPLQHELSGMWSRRINKRDRLIYRVFSDKVQIIQLKYHY